MKQRPKIVIETHNLSSHPVELQKTGIQEVVYSVLKASATVRERLGDRVEILCLPCVLDAPSRPAPFAPALNNTPAQLRETEQGIGLPASDLWGFDLRSLDYALTEDRARALLEGADWLLVTSHLDPSRLDWLRGGPPPKTAAIFYDLIPQLFPELVPPRIGQWYDEVYCQALRSRAQAFFAISRSAAIDLQNHKLGAAHPAAVFYRPLCVTPTAGAERPAWPELQGRPYFLVVGSTDPRKNTARLIAAFDRWIELFGDQRGNPRMALVIAGPKDWHFGPVAEAIEGLRKRATVITTGYLSDEQLHGAVRDAQAVLMPSRYEGYGLPLALARRYDRPAMAAINSSLPEAVECRASFVAPWSIDEMALSLQTLATQPPPGANEPHEPNTAEDTWVHYLSDLIETLLDSDKVSPCVN